MHLPLNVTGIPLAEILLLHIVLKRQGTYTFRCQIYPTDRDVTGTLVSALLNAIH